jgi:hypothetical protein
MPFWYNEKAEGSKFNSVACTDWATLNSNLNFDELAVKSDDEFHHLFGWCVSATDIIKMGEKNFKWEPQLLTFKIARKNYEKYDRTLKKRVPAEQSSTEKMFCKLLESLNLEKVYKAKLSLQYNNIVEMVLTEKDGSGQVLPESMVSVLAANFLVVSEVSEPEHIKLDELTLPAKGNWSGGGSKGQTEYEKLNDRFKFISEQITLAYPTAEIKSAWDIAHSLEAIPGMAGLWNILEQIIK